MKYIESSSASTLEKRKIDDLDPEVGHEKLGGEIGKQSEILDSDEDNIAFAQLPAPRTSEPPKKRGRKPVYSTHDAQASSDTSAVLNSGEEGKEDDATDVIPLTEDLFSSKYRELEDMSTIPEATWEMHFSALLAFA